jgi:hypothetical protein
MFAVPVTTTPSLRIGTPKELFSGRFAINTGTGPRPVYDITRDGRRFLMFEETGDGAQVVPPRFVVVQNWTEELQRLVPTN